MNAAVIVAALALGAAAPQRDTGRLASALPQATPRAATTSPAQAPALTRQAAIDSALAHNPQIEAAREQVAEARARVVQAIAIPDPSLSGTLDTENSLFGASPQKTVGLGVTVPFPDKIRLRGKVAGADVRSAELNVTLLQQQIGSQTAQAYDALLVAQQHNHDLLEQRQLALDFVKKTQARYNAGTAAKLDVVRAQVDASQAENNIIANERDIAQARAQLNRLMGRTLGADLALADSLAVPAALPELEGLRSRAQQLRPELLALAAQRRGAGAATALAREFWIPDFSVGLSGSGQPGSPNQFSTGLSIGFPIFFWQPTGGELAEARHRERELAANALDLAAQVEQDVRNAYADAGTALRQVIFIRDQLLPSTRDAYRIASTSYALGGSSALDVLSARRDLIAAQGQYADALGAANDAVARLELAVGGPLNQTPNGGPR
ncbi:MAG TPA: TolC family protein [Longimicrobiales bacterium]